MQCPVGRTLGGVDRRRLPRGEWMLLAVLVLAALGALGTAVLTSTAARAYLEVHFER